MVATYGLCTDVKSKLFHSYTILKYAVRHMADATIKQLIEDTSNYIITDTLLFVLISF
jgi:hypothetical protein